ncbi:cytochrome-c peroxidase [Bryobacter aggregatus]|uniref:cytochrome-c peroxidase n=1 Tax=Bryobacter aggregatus TaxID=360054 RepID=UPI00056668DF|nr:cytochrome c peroxidase [Bryobacter aggregatus]
MRLSIFTRLALLAPAVLIFAQDPALEVPLGLLPIRFPKDNPYTPAKRELGRLLYYDKRLSADGTVSCATCHDPKAGFTDGKAVSDGIRGQKGGRSAPTVFNRAYSLNQFWDGRAASLEEQAAGPMANPIEMGNTHDVVVSTLRGIPGYRARFKEVFGSEEFGLSEVTKAIATYERIVLSGNSPYDRYKAGNKKAMTAAQIRGMDVYFTQAKCDQCHEGINLTTNAYHNLGVGMDKASPDEGRFAVTKNPADWGAFKTPTLREIARTAPYMHDGSLATLEDVVEYYDKGGIANKNLDERIKPLKLTAAQKKDLVEFLKALSGEGWQSKLVPPTAFPQ